MSNTPSAKPVVDRVLARKVRLSAWALFLERLWPRIWLAFGVVGAFVAVSLAGVWPALSEVGHKAVLALFVLALLGAAIAAIRVRWPSRDEAIRRLEQRSGLAHRPASSYEDTLSGPQADPAMATLWQAHRQRLAARLGALKVDTPRPATHRHDPFALRLAMVLGVATLLGLVGDSARDRMAAAFRFAQPAPPPQARLDAWVTPPAYTGKPPLLLADGGASATPIAADAAVKSVEVPERSVLVVRASGAGSAGIELQVLGENGEPVKPPPASSAGKSSESAPSAGKSSEPAPAAGKSPEAASAEKARPATPGAAQASAADQASESRLELRQSGIVRVMSGRAELTRWKFAIIRDQAPRITLTKEVERTQRGSMKLTYKIEDDYGVAGAEAKFRRLQRSGGDPRTSWARDANVLKGPRPPLERPPVLSLRLPRSNAKETEASSHHEVGSHPWAGSPVIMTLAARDHAGNVGRSQPVEMILPQRRFNRPMAKAVIEQRRKLVEDPRYRLLVARAIDALTIEPESVFTDRQSYLGLRTVYHRLQRDRSRAGLRSAVDQLWHIALRLEDGGSLTEAERRLRDIQDQLSKALEEGASDEEMQRLMQELRQALAEFLQQLARQAENQPPMEMPPGMSPSQTMRPEDLDRMLRNLENMARQGSRDQAQDMLSQLRDLLEQLQSGRFAQGNQQQGQQMMQMMDQFGDLIGKQQRLMDDTFGEQGRQGEGQQGQRGQRGQQGQQGQQGQGKQGQGQRGQRGQGQQGQGQQGQQGQGQPGGRGQQPGGGSGQLGERQGSLRDQLGQLQQGMRQFGMRTPGQFDGAAEAMENAQRALDQGDLDTATQEQSRALEQLRQGAQSMAEQMMRQMPSRFGQGPAGDAPRDPLGRPQRSEGPDLGTSVRVPDEIDIQRAREILEELRRRIGEPTRPAIELDYIDRLLRRF